jgi:hypothetical protein
MAMKKTRGTKAKVGIKLSSPQRKLLLDDPIFIHKELAEPIRGTATTVPVMLTLDDWEDLAGHVAAEANHTTDKALRKKLNVLFARIQDVLEAHSDEEPPRPLKIEDAQREKQLTEQSVALAEWGAKLLIGAERLGIKAKTVDRYPLPGAERAVLMSTPTIDEKIQKKLMATSPKLTVGEVGGLLIAVAEAMLDASPSQGFALIMTAKSLMNCLESEVTGAVEPTAKSGASTTIYRLRITLEDVEPPVWRRVEVPDCTLGELHDVIQVAMGWQNSHLHQFILNGTYYGQATTGDLDMEDEEDIRLSQIFTGQKKPRLVYEYDFGDSWRHEIRLEKKSEPEPKLKYPRCVEGARACPPEDCGGAWGYADFLEAMADPKHPDHRDMKEWIGGRFDPEKFSVNQVNRELRREF